MAGRPVFPYDDVADAEADYEAVFDLHATGAIGTFDAEELEREIDAAAREGTALGGR